MTIVINKINYYSCDGGFAIGNTSSGSGAAENLNNVDITFESYIDGQPVIKVNSRAFYLKIIKSISLPETIEEIGSMAFDCCRLQMDELVLPTSLKSIGSLAFSSNSIKKIVIGANLKTVGSGAFSDNLYLEEIEVSQDNPYLLSSNFALYDKDMTVLYCAPYKVKNYVIPNTVTKLTARSLNNLYLTSIWVPHSVTTIETESFFRIPNVKSIHILGNVEELKDGIIVSTQYKVSSFYYQGTKVYNKTNAFNNRASLKVYACNEYNSAYFAGKKVIKFGSCFSMNHSCRQKKRSLLDINIVTSSIFLLTK